MRKLLLLLIFWSAITADAALTVTDKGTGTNNTSQASTAMSPTATIAVGATGVLCYAGDNAGGNATTNLPNSVVDSVGNTWYKRNGKINALAANSGAEEALYVSEPLTTQLTSSNNVTVTYTVANVTAKCWTFYEIAPGAGNVALLVNGNGLQAVSSGTPSITTGTGNNMDGAPASGDVLIGMVAAQSSDTFVGDADTLNGTWSTQQHTVAGSGATGMSISSQSKLTTAAGTDQVYNPTLTAAPIAYSLSYFHEVPSTVRRMIGNGVSAGTTTYTITLVRPMSVGSMGVMCISLDNAGSGGAVKAAPNSFTDSVGNVWTQQLDAIYDPGVASAGVEMSIYTAPITNAINAIGDNMVLTWDAGVTVNAKSVVIYEFTPTNGNTFNYIASGNAAGATTGTPTVTTSSITSGDIVIGMAGAEGTDTWVADADTSNGSWSVMSDAASGTGATADMSIASQIKTVTGTATQTYNPTLTSADTIIGWAQIRQVASATNPASLKIPNIPSIK